MVGIINDGNMDSDGIDELTCMCQEWPAIDLSYLAHEIELANKRSTTQVLGFLKDRIIERQRHSSEYPTDCLDEGEYVFAPI